MSDVTKEDLLALEQRISANTARDLTEMERRISANTARDLTEMERRIDAKADAMEKRLTDNALATENRIINAILSEMSIRFGEVNSRLDRVDATLHVHSRLIAAGTKTIAGFTQWISKADEDYSRVLADLADLKIRVAKIEPRP